MTTPHLLTARAGHWTGTGTGVTVIVPPPGTVASGEVRGGAPATRDFALLAPDRLVTRIDAVVLSGGSAFGLAAADGVLRALRSRGVGLATPAGPVPIVVGMSLFDDSVRDLSLVPTADSGRLALEAALGDVPFAPGRVGAGTGATTGTWRGRRDPGGLGVARATAGAAAVVAVVAVNAWGDVLAAGPRPPGGDAVRVPFGNTTLGVVLTDARLDKVDCHLLAQSAHDGFARAIHPAHSRYDGDAVVALATGTTDADLDLLRAATIEVTAEAIRSAVA